MSLDSHHLKQFIAIVESGSYRRAAERLHIAQPALTVSVKKLESALGVEVFFRTPQGVTLTPAGDALLGYARQALSVIEAGKAAALEASRGEHRLLRLGFVGSAVYSILPGILPAFQQQQPRIKLELTEGSTPMLIKQLRQGSLDACIVREAFAADSEFDAHCVEIGQFMAIVPRSHPASASAELDLRMLCDEPFIGFCSITMPALYAQANQLCALNGFVPRYVQQAARLQTVVSLVGCGLGVALVPDVAAVNPPDSVRCIPLQERDRKVELHTSIACRADNLSPAVTALMQFVRSQA